MVMTQDEMVSWLIEANGIPETEARQLVRKAMSRKYEWLWRNDVSIVWDGEILMYSSR